MRVRRGLLIVSAVLAATCLGCGLDNPGLDPPAGTLNFPIAIGLMPPAAPGEPASTLFVVSSNFDLHYNAGSVLAYDLQKLDDRIEAERSAGHAEPIAIDDATALLVEGGGEVRIGSYAAGLAVSPTGRRLYVPVRSDGDLTFVDVDASGALHCGGNGAAPRCDDFHSRGDDALANDRGIVLPSEPVGLTAGSLETDFGGPAGSGDYVLVADRSGRVSLFLDRAAPGDAVAPMLVHVATGFADGLSGIAFDPGSNTAFMPGSGTNEIGRAGIALDTRAGMLERSFVYAAGSLRLTGLSDGLDSRAIAFEPPGPGAPHRAFVASRRPEALLVLDLDRDGMNPGEAAISRVIEVGAGPARIAVARFGSPPRTFVFVSCFDGRELYAVDADDGELAAVVRGLSGPFEVAVDPVRGRLYVGDFGSSVVRVIDIEQLPLDGPARLIATLGKPRAAGSLQ